MTLEAGADLGEIILEPNTLDNPMAKPVRVSRRVHLLRKYKVDLGLKANPFCCGECRAFFPDAAIFLAHWEDNHSGMLREGDRFNVTVFDWKKNGIIADNKRELLR